MKSSFSFLSVLCAVALICLSFSTVLAFGPGPVEKGHTKTFWMTPAPATATCVNIAKGRATSVQVDMSTSLLLNWVAYDSETSSSPGTAVVVKRSFDSQTGYMPKSSELIGCDPTVSKVTFTRYSGATTLRLCYEKE